MVWPCQSTPASKIYVDGKLCLGAPDGYVMEMANAFQDAGYECWIQRLATLLNLKGLKPCGMHWGLGIYVSIGLCSIQVASDCF